MPPSGLYLKGVFMSIFKKEEIIFQSEFKYKGVDFTFYALVEHEPAKEHLIPEIIKEMDFNNPATWFCAAVESGDHYTTLGCCSYSSFEEFLDGDYIQDMREEVYQEVENAFAEREIEKLTCATNLVESMIKCALHSPCEENEFELENIVNYSYLFCNHCGEATSDDQRESCPACGEETETDIGYHEILEWWIVDNWQCRHLADLGECVLTANGLNFWGRTCSGQAIALDGTFQKIFRKINKEA